MRIGHVISCALVSTFVIACGPAGRPTGGDNGSGSGAPQPDAPPGVGTQCSSNLHDILDDQGNVVMTCPADQGCIGATCVPACEAAAASQGSVGCDFVVATPAFYAADAPPCFAAFIANNWPASAAVTISRDGVTYSASTIGRVPIGTPDATTWPAIPPSGVASLGVGVLFLSSDPTSVNFTPLTCPITPAVDTVAGSAVFTAIGASQTGLGKAWHITTSVPVSAYDILPYGGASSYLPSAELLLPTTAWGTNYVAVAPTPTADSGWGQLLAAQDNTTVMVSPSVVLPSGPGITTAPPKTTTTFSLNARDSIQWQDGVLDITGSIITSDKPVAFTGGAGYLCLTSATSPQGGGCDSAHQQVPPVAALGSLYVAPPYATRRADLQPESIRYRLVGTVAGTQLTYDPAVPGAPTTIAVGQVVEFEAIGPFTIKGQDAMHPFYVAQYMSGCLVTSGSRPGGDGCLGDEEFVNILPPAQWLSSYVFFTDPTYTTTNLVVVRKATTAGFQDVTVDCIGTLTGWQPVASGSEYEITNVDLQRDAPVGTCTNGRHTASSAGAFNIMVWGLSRNASYAYPAGGNVGTINSVVVIE